MLCDFTQQGDYCVCTRPECQRKLKKSQHPCEKHHAQCGKRGPQPVYLGDRVEKWLSSLGVTPERVVKFKQKLGSKSTKCGCSKRKELLNRLDRWVRRNLA